MFDSGPVWAATANMLIVTGHKRFLYRPSGNPLKMLLRLIVESRGGHVLIRAEGELDMSGAAGIQQAVADALGDGHLLVLLDLSGVTFVDSTGLSALVSVHLSAEQAGSYLAVVSPRESVRRVMRLLGVEDVLHLHDSVDEALQRAPGGPDSPA